jgi:hypothetical protein
VPPADDHEPANGAIPPREVMASLPRTRPQRRTARRPIRPDPASADGLPAPPKPRARAAPKATSKAAPKAASKAAPKTASKAKAAPTSKAKAASTGVRAPAPALEPTQDPTPTQGWAAEHASGAQAATEALESIFGLAGEVAGAGGRAVRGLLGRLRP